MHDVVIAELQALVQTAERAEADGKVLPGFAAGVSAALGVVGRLVVLQPTRQLLMQRLEGLRERYRSWMPIRQDLREDLRLLMLPKPPCPPFDWRARRLTSDDVAKRITAYVPSASGSLEPRRFYIHAVEEARALLSNSGYLYYGSYENMDPGSLED